MREKRLQRALMVRQMRRRPLKGIRRWVEGEVLTPIPVLPETRG